MNNIKLGGQEMLNLLVPYVRKKLAEQVQAVALIVIYLVLFQTLVLQIAIAEALVVAVGIAVIVVGLAFFMEGLFLGLMPLGETIGVRLPKKAKLPVVLVFALILGIGVTFAEPAIGVLQVAGSFIKAWDAPLLFLLLNKNADLLKDAVGLGVGLAVVAGMLRFYYNWSLKPFLYVGVPVCLALSIWANYEPNMVFLSGVAWDAGGVTTGPVTVPLVLALGIGVSRIMSKNNSEAGGFGVVTLASMFPVIAVFALGILFLPTVPSPLDQKAFFSAANREKVASLFTSDEALLGYALKNATVEAQTELVGGDPAALAAAVARLRDDADYRARVLGSADVAALHRWAVNNGSPDQRLTVFGSEEGVRAALRDSAKNRAPAIDVPDLLTRNALTSLQAILPLVLFLILVLVFVLRDRIPHPDEVAVGVVFALLGMFLFSMGIELGLSKLGNQVGGALPSSFKRIELTDQTTPVPNFDRSLVQRAVAPDGTVTEFFYTNANDAYVPVPFDASRLDEATSTYSIVPTKGPLFPGAGNVAGILLVLLFAFIMGYGATLAEPALNALGNTVEVLTVGSFKKSLLMQTVAIGVGLGIAVGVMKIIWNLPLVWLLVPPYLLLMVLTAISTEEFVNIGWDSAGVTTGPITVPLVLAMGLGIGTQIGVVEGFGILATASVYPILTVLAMGLLVAAKKKALLKQAASEEN